MRVLLLNQSDIQGGAAIAAHRLHTGLGQIGVESFMVVQQRSGSDPNVIAPRGRAQESLAHLRVAIDSLPLKRYPQRDRSIFSLQWLPDTLSRQISRLNPDIINLHWTGEALIRIETLVRLQAPIVWTLHDMWPFTGGCHYSQGCDRYLSACGTCPQLGSDRERDLSRWVWQRKQSAWKSKNLTIVALSSWLAQCARSSSLFRDCRVEQIPNGIDTTLYRPLPRAIARDLLGLPQDRSLVLFGALHATQDKRKGFHLLQPALQRLSQQGWGDRLSLVVLGATAPPSPPDLGFPIHYLGTLKDTLTLTLAYCAADVFVLPSVEENLANTVMESLACGTPCVAFRIGGMPDLVEHERNGYLATPFQVDDLAVGIAWILSDQERHCKLSHRARQKVEQEFTLHLQSHRYQALFNEVMNQKPNH